MPAKDSALFSSYRIRGTTFPNRIVLSPMMQCKAVDGFATDWHLVHFGKFALGGFGTVMTEVVAIEPRGRITYGDIGLWSDEQMVPLKRISDFLHQHGSLAAMQIGHAGRKAAWQRPWEGNGPLQPADAARDDPPWQLDGPSDEAVGEGYATPHVLTVPEIKEIIKRFGQTAARADAAGFDVLELHGAHGYLIASFLTPLINKRTDEYGGDRNSRMRFAFEVVNEVRANWPAHKPLFFRVSAEDGGGEGGWGLEDSVVLAAELHKIGVDVVDCSSGGLRASATLQNQGRGPGYQVPYARRIKSGAQIPTMAVGLILDGKQAQQIISSNSADFVAIGRQAMYDPFWGHHAAQQLDADPDFVRWDPSAGWWLQKRVAALDMVGYNSGGTLKASN